MAAGLECVRAVFMMAASAERDAVQGRELTAMVVWPTVGAMPLGRWMGRLCGSRVGVSAFTLGKLWAVAMIPLSLTLFGWMLLPVVARRYRLTNRRIVVEKGLSAAEGPSIELDAFDGAHVEVLAGQEWLQCGEIVFSRDGVEVFRLSGVSRPEVFLAVCLKGRAALMSVREVLQQQSAAVL
jgi:hypothetical protein